MSDTCHAREPIRNLTARPFRTTPARFRSAILTSRARWITRQAAPVGGCVITYTANGTQRVAVATGFTSILAKAEAVFTFTVAAYNLIRIPKLLAPAAA